MSNGQVREALAAVPTRVVIAANQSPTTELATHLLPGASFIEREGSWVNEDGRIQRFRRAYRARKGTREDLAWISALVAGPHPGERAPAHLRRLGAAHRRFAGHRLGTTSATGGLVPGLRREGRRRFERCPSFGALVLKAAIGWLFVLQMVPVMIWLERKGAAFIQDRIGPNRAFIPGLGLRLAGMVHSLADVVKILFKEDLVPRHVNRFYYLVAPGLAMFTALLVGAVIPYAHPIAFADGSSFSLQGLDANVGILFMLAVSSVAVYAVALAGWASNNKYSQLGGLRASANMISYEINIGLAIVGVLLVYNSTNLNDMVAHQANVENLALGFLPRWGILLQPVGFILYLVSAFAETNRNPFDLVEGEAELVAGLPHRIRQLQVRALLHGRVREHRRAVPRDRDAVLRRLADPVGVARVARQAGARLRRSCGSCSGSSRSAASRRA